MIVAKRKRRNVTLIEMMIVMFLIALISGVVAYNYRASLEEGRAFKTREGIERVRTILLLETAENDDAWEDIETNWQVYVARSPLASNAKTLVKDGWGREYEVHVIETPNGDQDIEVTSERYEAYKRARPEKFKE
ncbi:Putative outer membrane protein TC_0858 [Chlamydiales bacterium SCGC AG-110-P3]|nr:Putative outer membrane protein TC_0858 [Chlamydiales bacterium SCGC AG-110-P3]